MWWKAKHGWIGVDLGDRAIKVAQLTDDRNRLRLSAAAISLRPESTVTTSHTELANQIRAARALAEQLHGNRVAATLSMQPCRVEPTEADTLAAEGYCADHWSAGPSSSYTLSAPSDRIESAVEGFSRAGLRCEVIDGPPLALARVVRLIADYDPTQLHGVFDWGETSATFLAETNGQTRYVRRLGCGGLGAIYQSVAETLGVTATEASKLLRRHGAPSPPFTAVEHRLLHDAIRAALRPTVQELKRTLEHLGGKLKSPGPKRVFVFGAGGTVDGLAAVLGAALDLPTEPWRAERLERSPGAVDLPDCLLAQAIALSALAWESSH